MIELTVRCQRDLCREGEELEAVTAAVLSAERETSGVRTLPDETNAATGQPEGKEVDVGGGKELKESFPAPIPAGGVAIREEIDDFQNINVTHERNTIKDLR